MVALYVDGWQVDPMTLLNNLLEHIDQNDNIGDISCFLKKFLLNKKIR